MTLPPPRAILARHVLDDAVPERVQLDAVTGIAQHAVDVRFGVHPPDNVFELGPERFVLVEEQPRAGDEGRQVDQLLRVQVDEFEKLVVRLLVLAVHFDAVEKGQVGLGRDRVRRPGGVGGVRGGCLTQERARRDFRVCEE